jgi:MSHA biogenesis protein MshK
MNQLFLSCILAGATALVAGAVAGELPDPTRPPASLRVASPTPSVAAAPALVLQSVLIGEGRKPTAIINGRVVELGDSLDGQRLVRVFEGGALLAGPNGPTTLALTPDSEKVARTMQSQPQSLLALTKPTRRLDATAPMVRTGDRK